MSVETRKKVTKATKETKRTDVEQLSTKEEKKKENTEKMKVVLVEDDEKTVGVYRSIVDQYDMELSYVTDSEHRILLYLVRHEVDVMILDLELFEGDGISILSEIEERKLKKPFIVVVTNTVSNVTLSYARTHGADFVCQKMNLSYSPERVLAMIKKIFPYRCYDRPYKENPVILDIARQRKELIMRHTLEKELDLMGVRRSMVGYEYLIEAIMICANSKEETIHITNDIYPEIAERKKATTMSVERAMRKAIESAFTVANVKYLHRYYPFPYDDEIGRPTNQQFVVNMAKRIKI